MGGSHVCRTPAVARGTPLHGAHKTLDTQCLSVSYHSVSLAPVNRITFLVMLNKEEKKTDSLQQSRDILSHKGHQVPKQHIPELCWLWAEGPASHMPHGEASLLFSRKENFP